MITNSMSLLNPYLKSIKGFQYMVTGAVIEICLSCNRKRPKEGEALQGVGTVQIQGKQELGLVMWELGHGKRGTGRSRMSPVPRRPAGVFKRLEEGMRMGERSSCKWSRERREIEYHRK